VSQSEKEDGEISTEGRAANSEFSRMVREGRSFSGGERNCFYLNTGATPVGNGRFANISAVTGLDFPDDGRAVALVDWDRDGDLDLWISNRNAPRLRLMRNDQAYGNQFLALRLEGNGTTTNRDAIGARVVVEMKGSGDSVPQLKTLGAGDGFLSQSSKWLHFGLGAAGTIKRVTVQWPGGQIEEFTGLAANAFYRLEEGGGRVREVSAPADPVRLAASQQESLPSSQVARIPLVDPFPTPEIRYQGFDGKEHEYVLPEGQLTLVNFWASWCPPCAVEFAEFSERYPELQAAGINVLALSVEHLDGNAAEGMEEARKASAGRYPFTVGSATATVVADLQNLHNLIVPLHERLPLPVSFLVDRGGRLAVLYKGPVSVDQLLADATHSEGDWAARHGRAAAFPGQVIEHPGVKQVATDEAIRDRFVSASEFGQSGRHGEAVKLYADVLRLDPANFMAQSNLGYSLTKLGQNREAISHYQGALQMKPDESVPHYNLAVALLSEGKTREALEHLEAAVELDPRYGEAHLKLGAVLQEQGQLPGAIACFQRAIELDPDDERAHVLLGLAFKAQGQADRAVAQFEAALKINPSDFEAHANLASALLARKKFAEATGHYQRALELNPQAVEVRFNLGSALQQQGNPTGAVEQYLQVLPSMPEHPMVHARLADAYRDQGNFEAAVRHYLRTLQLKPEFPQPMNELARIRASHPDQRFRDGAEAVALAERCCEITKYRAAIPLSTLAAAYAETGQFEKAVQFQRRAIKLSPEKQRPALDVRLRRYLEKKPYREISWSGKESTTGD